MYWEEVLFMSVIYLIGLLCAITAFVFFNYKDAMKKFGSKNRSDYDESVNLENE